MRARRSVQAAGRSTLDRLLARAHAGTRARDDQLAEQSDRLDARPRRRSDAILAHCRRHGHLDRRRRRLRAAATTRRRRARRAVVSRPRRSRTTASSAPTASQGVADDRLAAGLDRRAAGADARPRQADRIQHVVLAGVRPARGRGRDHARRADGRAHAARFRAARDFLVARARARCRASKSRSPPGAMYVVLPRRRRRPTASRSASGSCARRGSVSHPAAPSGPEGEGLRALVLRAGEDRTRRRRRPAVARFMALADSADRRQMRCLGARGRRRDGDRRRAGRRHDEDAARRVSGRRERLRSAGGLRHLFVLRSAAAIFDPLYTLRLLRAAGAHDPEHRGRPAADHRRRAHVHDQGPAGHLLRRRSGVQGQEARARPRRTTSTASSASSIPRCARTGCTSARAPARRARRGARARAQRRHASTTTRRSRVCRRSTATRCASGSAEPVLRIPVVARVRRDFAAVAREVVDAYEDASQSRHGASGRHRRLSPQGSWTRGQKIVLEANPGFRDETLSRARRRQRAGAMRRSRSAMRASSCRSSAASR